MPARGRMKTKRVSLGLRFVGDPELVRLQGFDLERGALDAVLDRRATRAVARGHGLAGDYAVGVELIDGIAGDVACANPPGAGEPVTGIRPAAVGDPNQAELVGDVFGVAADEDIVDQRAEVVRAGRRR